MLLTASLSYGYEVSTEVTKKNVVLEEFTGIYCGYCPQAHTIAQYMHKARPEQLFVVGIHAGSYATPSIGDPDFRTDEGEAICTAFSASSFPIGTLNRHIFSGSSVLTSRSYWVKYAKTLYEEDAPVNLHLSSNFDGETRELSVTVEGYYTAEIEDELLCLSVLFTQNNIMGYQSGGGVGDEYMHQHVLRDFLTPTWGDTLATPVMGEYFTKTYSYIVPEEINDLEVVPEEIDVIAFVTADKTEVKNVAGGKPTYTNYFKPLGGTIDEPLIPISGTYGFDYFEVELTSTTNEEITAATFGVTINGETQTVAWSGSISSFASQYITLPVEAYLSDESSYEVEIELLTLNGTAIDSSVYEVSFSAPTSITPDMSFLIKTDYYADENTFVIKDEAGNAIQEFGSYDTNKSAEYAESAQLEANKVYCLEVTDSEGDGVSSSGYVKMYNDSEVFTIGQYTLSDFGCRIFFTTTSTPYQVTTEITKKKVLLEEFTGIYCGNCPDAHEMVSYMMDAHPEDFYSIAIHEGYYATPSSGYPDYRTEVGGILYDEFSPSYFPIGTVNRTIFRDNNILGSRSYWVKDAKAIYAADAPVNLRLTSSYDGDTRELVVNVKGYYTADTQEPLQCLSVALTQNNIIGYQSGGSSTYSHQHMLRAYLTPAWGDTLATPTKGEFFEKTYTYTLPESITDIAVMPEDIEVIAFVTADKTDILNAIGGRPTYTNYDIALGATIDDPLIPISSRYAYNFFELKLTSTTTEVIETATFDITINDETQTVEWSGSITAFESQFISLPVDEYEVLSSSNAVSIELVALNGTNIEEKPVYTASFSGPVTSTSWVNVYIKTDAYADENSYTIKDLDGNIEVEFGPYEAGSISEYSEWAELDSNKTYCLEVTDSEGDGISSGQIKMYKDDSSFLMQQYSLSDFGYRIFFTTSDYTSTMETSAALLYTYDSNSKTLSLCDTTSPAQISVVSVAGATLIETQSSTVSLATLPTGIYVVKIVQDNTECIVKLAL